MRVEEAISKLLNKSTYSKEVSEEIRRCEALKIDLIPIGDERYPVTLSQISDPPSVLYVIGNEKSAMNNFSIAIVGSRMATSYGRAVAAKISAELSKAGVVIVSGLAHGIDSVAHEEAVKNGLTIGVLGTGIDIIYPRSKATLFQKVMEKGCLISEFPLGTQPNKWTFPKRNRIIAGLSMGVVVVEASYKSGSLITARLALEEGREVFAVPGSIFSATSEGTNNLIKHGAKCVSSVEDILEEFGYVKRVENKRSPSDPILDTLKDGPKTSEEISMLLSTPIEEINTRLTMFEIDGIISKDLMEKFRLNL
ncbi:DNA-processing protein DprA [Athalassotoga sp.]|uniref:DNA-processing protein DprA n=1 Tax=Athalassotoga sp. TaxID=2022597 RepID=UPI003D076E79